MLLILWFTLFVIVCMVSVRVSFGRPGWFAALLIFCTCLISVVYWQLIFSPDSALAIVTH